MSYKEQLLSASKLNTTQSILNSLCQRLLHNSQSSPQPVTKKHQLNLTSEKGSKLQIVSSLIKNQANKSLTMVESPQQSPILKKTNLFTEPSEKFTKNQNNSRVLKSQIINHNHSDLCCVLTNPQIHQKLKKCKKNQFLLQSYREQVQYLKKLTFLQSQEIEKLRRLLRSQQDTKIKQKQLYNSNYLLQRKQKDSKLKTSDIIIPEKVLNDKIKTKIPRKTSQIKPEKTQKTSKRKQSYF